MEVNLKPSDDKDKCVCVCVWQMLPSLCSFINLCAVIPLESKGRG